MKKLNLEKLLIIFIYMLPILDVASFLFRKIFNTSFSPSTFIRPLIPMIVFIIIFFKNKFKLKSIIVGFVYLIYSIIHILLFNKLKTEISYGTVLNELQYLINYAFVILNLFIFGFVFYKKDTENLKKSILISMSIYTILIYASIITKTYSTTYVEGMGIKGWFESGNSLSATLILGLFILFSMLKNYKINRFIIPIIVLNGVFLLTLLGTRVAMFGFILVFIIFMIAKILVFIKGKFNKKTLLILLASISIIGCIVTFLGSNTLKRRQYVATLNEGVIDESTGKQIHITIDLMNLKNQIENNELSGTYMSKGSQKSLISLYEYANEHNINSTDRRTQQLVYNYFLVLNQPNILLKLFGNGLLANYAELTLEMEIPAFLFNFGLIGFTLYFVPFLAIFIYCLYNGFKYLKNIDEEYIILISGDIMAFALACFTGVTFFNSSTSIIIIVINILLLNKVKILGETK